MIQNVSWMSKTRWGVALVGPLVSPAAAVCLDAESIGGRMCCEYTACSVIISEGARFRLTIQGFGVLVMAMRKLPVYYVLYGTSSVWLWIGRSAII